MVISYGTCSFDDQPAQLRFYSMKTDEALPFLGTCTGKFDLRTVRISMYNTFFEWEFKFLPLLVEWLENFASCTTIEEKINRMKLSVAYDFIREFPILYIEPFTRREIEEYTTLEKKLQGDQPQQAKLETVQKCKTRAMRRLGGTKVLKDK